MRSEKRKTITTAFIADDGKEFYSERECKAYEEQKKAEQACIDVRELPHFTCQHPDSDYDYEIEFFFVRNEDDLDAVKRSSFSDPDASGWEFEAPCYPVWIRVLIAGDSGCGQIQTFDEVVEEAEAYVYDLKDTKERTEKLCGTLLAACEG